MTFLWVVLAILYVAMFFWLGLTTLRNGHGWLFFFGIFFPILWIVGAFMAPTGFATGGPADGTGA